MLSGQEAGPSARRPSLSPPPHSTTAPSRKRARPNPSAPSINLDDSSSSSPAMTTCLVSHLSAALQKAVEQIAELEKKQTQADVFAATVLTRLLEVEKKTRDGAEAVRTIEIRLDGMRGSLGDSEASTRKRKSTGILGGTPVMMPPPTEAPVSTSGGESAADGGIATEVGVAVSEVAEPVRKKKKKNGKRDAGQADSPSETTPLTDEWLVDHGYIIDKDVFDALPIAYYPHYKFFRCNRCDRPIASLRSHFGCDGPHPSEWKSSLKHIPNILTAYPEADPYSLLPANVSPAHPLPRHIPDIRDASGGYSCDLCPSIALTSHSIRLHINTVHNIKGKSKGNVGPTMPYTVCHNLQRFGPQNKDRWFPSSPAVTPADTSSDPLPMNREGPSSPYTSRQSPMTSAFFEYLNSPPAAGLVGGSSAQGSGQVPPDSGADEYESEVEEEIEWPDEAISNQLQLPPLSQNTRLES